jgi:hypothetical protein
MDVRIASVFFDVRVFDVRLSGGRGLEASAQLELNWNKVINNFL